ncbi:MAG: hypothetical protein NUV82_02860 [Candidatus Komeilibacteria bacterium]|nr:hypothetical protein [Candidatus Komeilibacteria bacterium]
MKDVDIDLHNLCRSCGVEPVYMQGLCEFCFSEVIEEDLEDEQAAQRKAPMPKHGQSLKAQSELHQSRGLDKLNKLEK